jgi:RHS repeat-associated protein
MSRTILRASSLILLLHPISSGAYIIDVEPEVRNSPLLATPEPVKTDPGTGAATYSYRFELPDGTGGLTPELALTYSSLTTNTEYGWGWMLSIPKIERCTRFGTPTYDDSVDQFELDGELLVRDPTEAYRFHKSAHDYSLILYNSTGSTWEVVRPDGLRLRFGSRATTANSKLTIGPTGSGAVFRWYLDEVLDPRGNSYRIDYEGDTYSLGGSQYYSNLYPKEIRYSYNQAAGDHPRRLVAFVWEYRGSDPTDPDDPTSDRPTSYRSGFKVQISRRLKKVAVSLEKNGEFEEIRSYVLKYAAKPNQSVDPSQTPFSRLLEIQRHAPDGTRFPSEQNPRPTRFEYHLSSRDFPVHETWDPPPSSGGGHVRVQLGNGSLRSMIDMNGDGILDRVWIDGTNQWWVARGKPAGLAPDHFEASQRWDWDCTAAAGGAYSCSSEIAVDGTNRLTQIVTSGLHSYVTADVIDMDGDHLPDRIVSDTSGDWTFYRNVGTGFAPMEPWSNPLTEKAGACAYRRHINSTKRGVGAFAQDARGISQLADANGDGLPDHVAACVDAGGNRISVGLNRARVGLKAFQVTEWYGQMGQSSDGDPFLYLLGAEVFDEWTHFKNLFGFADLNGDAIPDRYLSSIYGSESCGAVFFGTGNAWQYSGGVGHLSAASSFICPYPINLYKAAEERRNKSSSPFTDTWYGLHDMNGDGVLDRVETSLGNPGPRGVLHVFFGLGDGRFLLNDIQWVDPMFGPLLDTSMRREHDAGAITMDLLDVDGDGLSDLVQSGTQWNVYKQLGPLPGLLWKVTNELGGVTEIDYEPSTSFVGPSDAPEDLSSSHALPLARPVWVVANVSVSDGRTGTDMQPRDYTYAEFRFDPDRRRYLGARQVDSVDAAGTLTRTFFHQARGVEGRIQLEKIVGSAGTLYKAARTNWGPITPKKENGTLLVGHYFAAPIEDTIELYDPASPAQAPQVAKTMRYFDERFGVLTTEVDLGDDAQTGGGDDYSVYHFPNPNVNHWAWLIDYPCFVSVSVGGQQIQTQYIAYDNLGTCIAPAKGLATFRSTDRRFEFESDVLYEGWVYDPYGNATDYFGPQNTWTVTYEPELATYVDSLTNALGHTTRYRHSKFEHVDRRLDPNGYLECWGFDQFGRLASRSDYPSSPQTSVDSDCSGSVTRAQFFFPLGNPEFQGIQALEYADANTSIVHNQWFDGLGRIHREERQAVSLLSNPNDFFVTSRSWGSRGELQCETLPQRGPPGQLFCDSVHPRLEFQYDPLLRLSKRSLWTPLEEEEESITYSVGAHPNEPGGLVLIEGHTIRGPPDLQRQIMLDHRGDPVVVSEGGEAATRFKRDGKGRIVLVDAPDVSLPGGAVDENLLAISYDGLDNRKRIVRPPASSDLTTGPTWTFEYDLDNKLFQVIPPKGPGHATRFYYDDLNRLIVRDYAPFFDPNGPVLPGVGDHRYTYDAGPAGIGRLREADYIGVGALTTFGYNLRGEIIEKERVLAGKTFSFDYAFDGLGRRSQVIYPDGDVIAWVYDGSLLSEVVRNPLGTPETLLDQIQTHANGRITSARYSGLSLVGSRIFDPGSYRLQEIRTTSGGSVIQSLVYSIDTAGNVNAISDASQPPTFQVSQTFGYDSVHRLSSAMGAGPAYGYPQRAYAYLPPGSGNLTGKDGRTQIYGEASAGPAAVTSVEAGPGQVVASYLYDQNGAVSTKVETGGAILWRDDAGRLTQYDPEFGPDTLYGYDTEGWRFRKLTLSNPLKYVIYVDDEYEVAVHHSRHTKHVYLDGSRALSIRRSGDGTAQDPGDPATETRIHYHPDHLGSNVLVTDGAGNVVQRTYLGPYGEVRWVLDGAGNDISAATWATNYLFTRQEYDRESGFYYYGTRYYDPAVGRFLSTDPDVIGATPGVSFARAIRSAGNLNAYSYVLNRPTVLVDLDGRFSVGPDVLEQGGVGGGFDIDNELVVDRPLQSPLIAPDVLLGIVSALPRVVSRAGISFLHSGADDAALIVGRSVGAQEAIFTGKKLTRELAESLGLDRRTLGKAVERIKKAYGLRGNENVSIGRATGDVFDPRTGELLGNVLDEAPFVK